MNPAENTIELGPKPLAEAHGETYCFQQDLAQDPGEPKQRCSYGTTLGDPGSPTVFPCDLAQTCKHSLIPSTTEPESVICCCCEKQMSFWAARLGAL